MQVILKKPRSVEEGRPQCRSKLCGDNVRPQPTELNAILLFYAYRSMRGPIRPDDFAWVKP
jgi:hypothetical protein